MIYFSHFINGNFIYKFNVILELEYDHLDYSRPGSSWKPHYQRMANGFGTINSNKSDKTDKEDV